MTSPFIPVYLMLIEAGRMNIEDVPAQYTDAVRSAYLAKHHIEL